MVNFLDLLMARAGVWGGPTGGGWGDIWEFIWERIWERGVLPILKVDASDLPLVGTLAVITLGPVALLAWDLGYTMGTSCSWTDISNCTPTIVCSNSLASAIFSKPIGLQFWRCRGDGLCFMGDGSRVSSAAGGIRPLSHRLNIPFLASLSVIAGGVSRGLRRFALGSGGEPFIVGPSIGLGGEIGGRGYFSFGLLTPYCSCMICLAIWLEGWCIGAAIIREISWSFTTWPGVLCTLKLVLYLCL